MNFSFNKVCQLYFFFLMAFHLLILVIYLILEFYIVVSNYIIAKLLNVIVKLK